jgi:GGDEF domain-containing protein
VVVCPDLASAAALEIVAGRATAAVAEPATVGDGITVTPRISLGCALARDDEDADALLARADAAMYAVKRTQRAARM